ncbi:phosphate/phosphite/phosphonate ABC transporter substrate-binding protein [Pseudomonas rhodesiae]|uniref:phosphate/phosphite/phosphonate ABC transporter substrate-binding protein n=1 Tax=Pseudomonas rhodesiae TaxID=76760 RepID=UPI0020A0882E|nr:PhnD/SsuA/transferrin family substrate-binding protein [Pseudomonas rhodesiae]MCP1511066.1 ABC-type phosphate/phosphonate transport system substrate-binding protein [Pseudomonas rhodesiae]MDF9769883.1 ABC-type phosphate/phosphonate transport system substrate-binding protein [Pseudomonas rhodesiae]
MTSDLSMYLAPARISQAQDAWLERILAILGERREQKPVVDLASHWLSPDLLLSQTCGYPFVTSLRGKVRLIGRPSYELTHSSAGSHCSLLLCRADSDVTDLAGFQGSHGLINAPDSNSGMNLLRHTLAGVSARGFFSTLTFTGSHRESMRRLKEGAGDLASIDSVTYDYLARDNSAEIEGLRILLRSARSPCLPYITSIGQTAADAASIRNAMNEALNQLPEVSRDLAIKEVLPASEADYECLLEYERSAASRGFSFLAC